jgi:hypothetical protein
MSLIGATVCVKGSKRRAIVVQDLSRGPKNHDGNQWQDWFLVEPRLNGFSRWHRDELEIIKPAPVTP